MQQHMTHRTRKGALSCAEWEVAMILLLETVSLDCIVMALWSLHSETSLFRKSVEESVVMTVSSHQGQLSV